jgi:small subunit ribosomal protein S17
MPRREKIGTVVSDKMNKTRVVAVVERTSHPRYKKVHLRTIRFKAHDENNTSVLGDTVSIVESRPLSKEKCWALKKVLQHAEEV